MPSSAPPPSRLDTRYARVFATTTADSTSVVIRPRQTLPSPPSYPPPSHSWWTDKRGPANIPNVMPVKKGSTRAFTPSASRRNTSCLSVRFE